MNAWPPQASSLLPTRGPEGNLAPRFSATQPVDAAPSRVGVARTLSREPFRRAPTNTLASVEPPSPYTLRGEYGQVGCGLSLFSGFLAVRQDYQRALLLWLATTDLTRVPRIQVFCPRSGPFRDAPPTALPSSCMPKRYVGHAGLDSTRHCTAWDYCKRASIPVVTFLAPLASNFEGLKDR
jgi:hypothetical protein